MKNIADLIKYIIAIWIAYPIASVLSYFSPASPQKAGWVECFYISVFLTIVFIVIYCVKKHKMNKIDEKISYYDLMEQLISGTVQFKIKYHQYIIYLYKKENSYICEIRVKNKLKKTLSFDSKESLQTTEIMWCKSLYEIIDESELIEVTDRK